MPEAAEGARVAGHSLILFPTLAASVTEGPLATWPRTKHLPSVFYLCEFLIDTVLFILQMHKLRLGLSDLPRITQLEIGRTRTQPWSEVLKPVGVRNVQTRREFSRVDLSPVDNRQEETSQCSGGWQFRGLLYTLE